MNSQQMHGLLNDAVNITDLIEYDLEAMEEMLVSIDEGTSPNYKNNDASIQNLKSYYGFRGGLEALRERALRRLKELKKNIKPVWLDTNPYREKP
jgi:hypothetical protein